MTTLHVWEDTERSGLDDLPPIPWEPPRFGLIPTGEVRELFGKVAQAQWEMAVRLQEQQQ